MIGLRANISRGINLIINYLRALHKVETGSFNPVSIRPTNIIIRLRSELGVREGAVGALDARYDPDPILQPTQPRPIMT